MALLNLSRAEIDFLAQPLGTESASIFVTRLTQGLADTLHARLRTRVRLLPRPHRAMPVTVPHWRVSPELSGLWLMRRLGASGPGRIEHVPPALLRTLDAVLAERWLDAPATVPEGCAWQIAAGFPGAVLELDLPGSPVEMQRWAQETIRS